MERCLIWEPERKELGSRLSPPIHVTSSDSLLWSDLYISDFCVYIRDLSVYLAKRGPMNAGFSINSKKPGEGGMWGAGDQGGGDVYGRIQKGAHIFGFQGNLPKAIHGGQILPCQPPQGHHRAILRPRHQQTQHLRAQHTPSSNPTHPSRPNLVPPPPGTWTFSPNWNCPRMGSPPTLLLYLFAGTLIPPGYQSL